MHSAGKCTPSEKPGNFLSLYVHFVASVAVTDANSWSLVLLSLVKSNHSSLVSLFFFRDDIWVR